MSEIIPASPNELLEIERFIHEIAIDTQHPLNDHHHPQHHECLMALHDLLEMADSLRSPYLAS